MSLVPLPTFGRLNDQLLGVLAAESNVRFYRKTEDVAYNLNEGLRLQDAAFRKALRAREGGIAAQLENPYLQRFLARHLGRVLRGENRFQFRANDLAQLTLGAAVAGGSLTTATVYRARLVYRDPLTNDQIVIGGAPSGPQTATAPNLKIPYTIAAEPLWEPRFSLADIYRTKGGVMTAYYLEETVGLSNLDDVPVTGYLDKADTELGALLPDGPGPDLRGREVVLMHAPAAPPYESMIFRYVTPTYIALARQLPSYRPSTRKGYYTRSSEQAEYDLFFPTRDLTAYDDIAVELLWLKTIDDFTLFDGTDDDQQAPVEETYLLAPLQWAAARMMERQGEPPDVYEERFATLLKQGP